MKEKGEWHFVVPPEDTKTHVPIDFELPQEFRESLDNYLQLVRSRLLGERQRRNAALLGVSAGSDQTYD
jgi:hypothetical protein